MGINSGLTVSGDFVKDEGEFIGTGGAVRFAGEEDQTIDGLFTFDELVVANEGDPGVYSVSADSKVVVEGGLEIVDGRFVVGSNSEFEEIRLAGEGDFEITGTIYISGDFTNNGRFLHNDNNVIFNGLSQVYGHPLISGIHEFHTITVYGLVAFIDQKIELFSFSVENGGNLYFMDGGSLWMASGSESDIKYGGGLYVKGIDENNKLTIRPADYDPYYWNMRTGSDYLIGWVNVMDCHASGQSITAYQSLHEAYNNDNWIFSQQSMPELPDEDVDGLPTWWEKLYGLDWTDGTDDQGGDGDKDNDGLTNFIEMSYNLNPTYWDTDYDLFSDTWEMTYFRELQDGTIIFNPRDSDFIRRNQDTDLDGLTNGEEAEEGTNPLSGDTDGDGLSDEYEITYAPVSDLDPIVDNSDYFLLDSDFDMLPNWKEQQYGTNPEMADSDGDGRDDGLEVYDPSPSKTIHMPILTLSGSLSKPGYAHYSFGSSSQGANDYVNIEEYNELAIRVKIKPGITPSLFYLTAGTNEGVPIFIGNVDTNGYVNNRVLDRMKDTYQRIANQEVISEIFSNEPPIGQSPVFTKEITSDEWEIIRFDKYFLNEIAVFGHGIQISHLWLKSDIPNVENIVLSADQYVEKSAFGISGKNPDSGISYIDDYCSDPTCFDTDSDGLADFLWDGVHWVDGFSEYYFNGDPMAKDTDRDGLIDKDELYISTYNGYASTWTLLDDADTDDDGLLDSEEATVFDLDTNSDGILSSAERVNNFFPIGAPPYDECTNVFVLAGKTDPNQPDSDVDGILDGVEVGVSEKPHEDCGDFVGDVNPYTVTDPLDADTDDDGLVDGVADFYVFYEIDENSYYSVHFQCDGEDLNCDGAIAGDSDNDGYMDSDEDWAGETNPETDPSKPNPGTNKVVDGFDTDGDGLSDGLESGWNRPQLFHYMPYMTDSAFQEDMDITTQTDPLDADSDDDGLLDGYIDLYEEGFDRTIDNFNEIPSIYRFNLDYETYESSLLLEGELPQDIKYAFADEGYIFLSDDVEIAEYDLDVWIIYDYLNDELGWQFLFKLNKEDWGDLGQKIAVYECWNFFGGPEGEDYNLNGAIDLGETDPRYETGLDTDGDGHCDGKEIGIVHPSKSRWGYYHTKYDDSDTPEMEGFVPDMTPYTYSNPLDLTSCPEDRDGIPAFDPGYGFMTIRDHQGQTQYIETQWDSLDEDDQKSLVGEDNWEAYEDYVNDETRADWHYVQGSSFILIEGEDRNNNKPDHIWNYNGNWFGTGGQTLEQYAKGLKETDWRESQDYKSEDTDLDGLWDNTEMVGWVIQVDKDGDGDYDGYNINNNFDDDGNPIIEYNIMWDIDGDGNTEPFNEMETYRVFSDPTDDVNDGDEIAGDTDNDGISDYDEWKGWGRDDGSGPIVISDPMLKDTDFDGLDDNIEKTERDIQIHFGDSSDTITVYSDPSKSDTDGDGLSDFLETNGWVIKVDLNGDGDFGDTVDSRSETYTTYSNPCDEDTDDDGLTDYEEWYGFNIPNIEDVFVQTDPLRADTDNDGLTDEMELMGWDIYVYNNVVTGVGHDLTKRHVASNPSNIDTDDDDTSDFNEYEGIPYEFILVVDDTTDIDSDAMAIIRTDPTKKDTDDDNILDSEEISGGADGYITNPVSSDTDFDGIVDSIEINGWDVAVYRANIEDGEPADPIQDNYFGVANPLDSDTDNDGRSDGWEFSKQSNPANEDTDYDGLLDSEEDDVDVVFVECEPPSVKVFNLYKTADIDLEYDIFMDVDIIDNSPKDISSVSISVQPDNYDKQTKVFTDTDEIRMSDDSNYFKWSMAGWETWAWGQWKITITVTDGNGNIGEMVFYDQTPISKFLDEIVDLVSDVYDLIKDGIEYLKDWIPKKYREDAKDFYNNMINKADEVSNWDVLAFHLKNDLFYKHVLDKDALRSIQLEVAIPIVLEKIFGKPVGDTYSNDYVQVDQKNLIDGINNLYSLCGSLSDPEAFIEDIADGIETNIKDKVTTGILDGEIPSVSFDDIADIENPNPIELNTAELNYDFDWALLDGVSQPDLDVFGMSFSINIDFSYLYIPIGGLSFVLLFLVDKLEEDRDELFIDFYLSLHTPRMSSELLDLPSKDFSIGKTNVGVDVTMGIGYYEGLKDASGWQSIWGAKTIGFSFSDKERTDLTVGTSYNYLPIISYSFSLMSGRIGA